MSSLDKKLYKKLKEKPSSNKISNEIVSKKGIETSLENSQNGDQCTMEAAKSLVALANSSTPTENKQIIELLVR